MKKIWISCLIILLMLLTTACGKDTEEKTIHEYFVGDSKVGIYYPEGKDVVCDENIYQIKQPDSISASIEEIMSALDQKLADKYVYHTYMLDEQGSLSLTFAMQEERDEEYELLMKAAVSLTLFQLKEIKKVTIEITSEGGQLIDTSSFGRESFYFYDYDSQMGLNKRTITVYHANENGDDFETTLVEVEDKPDISVVEQIIEYLERHKYIPEGTKIETLAINSGVCYLELSKEFLAPVRNIKCDIVVYSIVNSLTQIDGVNKVKIYIKGMDDSKYRDSIELSQPLGFESDFNN